MNSPNAAWTSGSPVVPGGGGEPLDTATEQHLGRGLSADLSGVRVHTDGEEIQLTQREFDVLLFMARHAGQAFTRDQLMDRVWGYHGDATSRTLDTHVRRLRDKLGEAGSCVETVRGVGYVLEERH